MLGIFSSLLLSFRGLLWGITFIVLYSFSNAVAQTPVCIDVDTYANSPNFNAVNFLINNDPAINVTENGSPGVLGNFRQVSFGPIADDTGIASLQINGSMAYSNGVAVYAPLIVTYDANGAGLNANFNDGITVLD